MYNVELKEEIKRERERSKSRECHRFLSTHLTSQDGDKIKLGNRQQKQVMSEEERLILFAPDLGLRNTSNGLTLVIFRHM